MEAQSDPDQDMNEQGSLFGQTVLAKVAVRIQAQDRDKASRFSILFLCLVVGIPLIDFFDRMGSPARGDIAAVLVADVLVIGLTNRESARQFWFWISIAGLLLLDLVIWRLVPAHWVEPRGGISVVGYADYFLGILIFRQFERRFKRVQASG